MKVFHALPLLLALGLLAACDEQPKSPPQASQKTETEARPGKPAPTPPPAPKKAEEKPAPKPAPAPPKPAKPAAGSAVKTPLPPVKLDLHLPEELVQGLEPGTPVEPPKPLLPPMFMEKPTQPGPYQLNGRLITNDRGDDYWDSVEGAELQIEFRN